MNSSDFIWRLVKSLSKQEIEWFYRVAAIREVHSKEEETPEYISFFRELRSLETYSEQDLKQKYPVNNFSELKARVRDIVYKAVLFYDPNPAKIRNQEVSQIEWLLDKGFLDEAQKQLRRTKKKVMREEAFLEHLSLLDLEMNMLLDTEKPKSHEAKANQISRERDQVLDQYHNLQDYIGLYQNIHTKIRSHYTPHGRFTQTYVQQIQDHPLMQNEQKALSERAKLYFLRLQYISTYLTSQEDRSLDILQKLVLSFEAQAFLNNEMRDEYFLRKCLLSLALIKRNQLEEGLRHIELFQAKRKDSLPHFYYYFTGMLGYIIHSRDFSDYQNVIKEVEMGLNRFWEQLPMNRKYLLWYNLGQILYYNGKLKEAKRFIGKIIENPSKKFREDLQGTARIIMVLIQYELNDIDALEYYVRMASQYLRNRGAIFPFERSFLNFFRLCIRDTDTDRRLKSLMDIQQKIGELLANDSEIRAFHFFDYESWINSNIEKLKSAKEGHP